MRSPYCEREMREGQLHAVGRGPALVWKDDEETLRLNTEPDMVARTLGDRIAAYRCDYCKKIIVNYE